jgi:D-methionine transport system substrate-binding protein
MSDDRSTLSAVDEHLARRRKRTRIGVAVGAVVVVAAAGVIVATVVGQQNAEDAEAAAGGGLVKLRIADTARSDFQDEIVEVGRENGLDLEFISFDDPYLPNTALLEGEVDGNSFQHVAWLSAFNRENDSDITPVFSTIITQWGLFSASHDSIDALPDAARIAVPDDAANFSRSLFILENAGVIEVADDAGVFPTEEDITANPGGIELVRIAHEAVQTAYEDPAVDGVIIGTDDFDPNLEITSDDALALEDSSATSSSPYVIVVATRADNADDPAWELLEKTYRDDRVVAALEEEKRGQASVVEIPVSDLRNALDELVAE